MLILEAPRSGIPDWRCHLLVYNVGGVRGWARGNLFRLLIFFLFRDFDCIQPDGLTRRLTSTIIFLIFTLTTFRCRSRLRDSKVLR